MTIDTIGPRTRRVSRAGATASVVPTEVAGSLASVPLGRLLGASVLRGRFAPARSDALRLARAGS